MLNIVRKALFTDRRAVKKLKSIESRLQNKLPSQDTVSQNSAWIHGTEDSLEDHRNEVLEQLKNSMGQQIPKGFFSETKLDEIKKKWKQNPLNQNQTVI